MKIKELSGKYLKDVKVFKDGKFYYIDGDRTYKAKLKDRFTTAYVVN